MSTHRLRAATVADAEAILGVHRHSILELGLSAYTAEECESWAAGLVAERYVEVMTTGGESFLVVEDAAGLCGFCSFKKGEICGLYVHPRAAGKGVGTMLLSRAEEVIRVDPPEAIRLGAALSALPFYRTRGYRILKRKKWKTRGGLEIEVCDMEKRL